MTKAHKINKYNENDNWKYLKMLMQNGQKINIHTYLLALIYVNYFVF